MSLRHGELKGLVIPMVGIDKYQPKVGKESEVIVVSFYVKDQQAALDLEKFLEMGNTQTLDTETSPNPDDDGHYLVFVEIKRDKRFWINLRLLLRDIENTTEKVKWSADIYKQTGLYRMNDPKLHDLVITDQMEYEAKNTPDEELADEEMGDIEDVLARRHNLQFEAFTGGKEQIALKFDLHEHAIATDRSYEHRIIEQYVGTVDKIGDYYVLENTDTYTLFRRKND